jgi:hypothetical protein
MIYVHEWGAVARGRDSREKEAEDRLGSGITERGCKYWNEKLAWSLSPGPRNGRRGHIF